MEKPRTACDHWDLLPDLVVERIFCYLPKLSRFNAAVTCKAWLRVLYFPQLWKTFTLRERTLTRSKFDYYKGYQDKLDPFVTAICMKRIGRHFRRLKILPISDFHNLFEFLTIVDGFLRSNFNGYPMYHLKAFEFYFACQLRTREGIRVFGTGGRMLQTITTFMGDLQDLEELHLENLLLDRLEAPRLLDSVFQTCSESLLKLSVVNCTKISYFFMHCGLFLNLRCLTISANHLHADLIYLVSCLEDLAELHVVQTEFTKGGVLLNSQDWAPMRTTGKFIKVFIEVKNKSKEELIWQQKAPVFAIVYSTPYSRLSSRSALEIIHHYGNTLRAYCQFGLPRFPYKRGRPLESRCDSQLLLLVRTCTCLRTVVIHELVSISTLLLVAFYGKGQLRELFVRRNAVLRRDDWTRDSESALKEKHSWLKEHSVNYDTFEEEIGTLLGRKWRALSDLEFRQLNLAVFQI